MPNRSEIEDKNSEKSSGEKVTAYAHLEIYFGGKRDHQVIVNDTKKHKQTEMIWLKQKFSRKQNNLCATPNSKKPNRKSCVKNKQVVKGVSGYHKD